MNLLEFSWQLLVILLLVLANGFFVAAEFALVKVRVSQLKPLLKTGDWRVKFALIATKHLDAYLSATQLGITLASLGLGWLGEPFVSHWIAPALSSWGITKPAALHSISTGVAFTFITFLHIILGELAPKSLAIQRPKITSLWISAPLILFYYLFLPFIWILNGTANYLLSSVGIRPANEADHSFTTDELEYVLSHSRHSHPGDSLISKIMIRSLRLRDTTAAQIMLPRDKVVALWLDRTPEENIKTAQTSGHSRFPVCQSTLDDAKGMILIKEWLWQIQALGSNISFEPLVRPVLTFTLKTPLPSMLELFRSSRSHLAVVLDANGGMAGIITFEDVLEEIVGEIRDELDIEKGPIYEHTENSILIDASLSLREVRAETGWSFEWEPRETVEQWIIRQIKRIPKRGEKICLGEFLVEPTETHAQGIRRVRIIQLTHEQIEKKPS